MVRWLGVAALVCAAFGSSLARAENMMTTQSLSAGKLALGLEAQAGLVDGTPMLLNLHQSVGLRGGFDIYAREGIGLGDNRQGVYIGAGIKWTILSGRRDRPGLALLAGGHYFISNYGGADATFYVDYTISRVTPYLALDLNVDFPRDVDFKLGLLGGARIGVVQNVEWFIEGQVGFTGNPKNHLLATGPRIRI